MLMETHWLDDNIILELHNAGAFRFDENQIYDQHSRQGGFSNIIQTMLILDHDILAATGKRYNEIGVSVKDMVEAAGMPRTFTIAYVAAKDAIEKILPKILPHITENDSTGMSL